MYVILHLFIKVLIIMYIKYEVCVDIWNQNIKSWIIKVLII